MESKRPVISAPSQIHVSLSQHATLKTFLVLLFFPSSKALSLSLLADESRRDSGLQASFKQGERVSNPIAHGLPKLSLLNSLHLFSRPSTTAVQRFYMRFIST